MNLDILFRREAGSFRAIVIRSPAGDGQSVIFKQPLTDVEIELFVLKVGRFRARTRRVEAAPMVAAKEAGRKLFDAVFTGAVGECLRRSIDRANEEQAVLRIRLQIPDDCPELSNLPWELLYDQRDDWFLALSGRTPVIRYVQLPVQARPVRTAPPLRILVIKSEPTDSEPLDLDGEWAQVFEALGDLISYGQVSVTELAAPTLSQLRRVLFRDSFHVLHYMGHGGFDQHAGGTLLFTDRSGRGAPVTAEELGVMLHDHSSLRLAVLNACEAGRTDATDPFAGVAATLVRRGIPAVVAMQFEITDRAAVELAPALYGALADGFPVDTAVAEARKAIRAISPLEWITPVLYLRADDARLFDFPPTARPRETAAGPVPDQAGHMREPQLGAAMPGAPETSLTIGIAGPAGSGKTVLTTVLGRHLREAAGPRFRAEVCFATVNPGGYQGPAAYQAHAETPLYSDKLLPSTTERQGTRQAPVVLRWRQEMTRSLRTPVSRSALLSLIDIPGADLADTESVYELDYLPGCDALIFAIDPIRLANTPARPQLPSAARTLARDESLDVISRVTERLRTELAIKNSQRINIPAAVVMTKIDEFYPAFTRQSPLTMVPRDAPAYDLSLVTLPR